jgi:hypothetical protein
MFYRLKNIEFYKLERIIYIFLGFILPFFFVILFFYYNLFNKNEHYCWIGIENSFAIKVFYIFLLAILLVNLVLITICCYPNFSKEEENNNDISREALKAIKSQINKMLIFPILFIFCWILPFIKYNTDFNIILDVLCISYPCILGLGVSLISFYLFYSAGVTLEFLFCEKKNNNEEDDDTNLRKKINERKNTNISSITIKS